MKSNILILAILFGVVAISEVQSGIVLSGLHKIHERTKCGLHKLGNRLRHHGHGEDPCIEQVHTNELEQITKDSEIREKGVNYGEVSTPKATATLGATSLASTYSTTTGVPVSGKGNTNKTIGIEEGRRLITAGANCADGYRADANGKCYIEY